MRFDINETILRHIATGGGAAALLRKTAAENRPEDEPSLVDASTLLFAARSDVRRLQRADMVARAILHINDFADIIMVREIVAQQELKRLIQYAKQKDHTSHTVYLYFLGIWFFDSVPRVKEAMRHASKITSEAELCEWFLFRWLFASLLHDVGYAFYELSGDTKADRMRIDNIYSWDWLASLLAPIDGGPPPGLRNRLSPGAVSALKASHTKWREYGSQMPPVTAESKDSRDILERLSSAPWLGDLNESWKGVDIFGVIGRAKNGRVITLREYAFNVAKHGYGEQPGPGFVDHAVASGLLLFQYVSYWYWLMNDLSQRDAAAYVEVVWKHDYRKEKLSTKVVDACRAVAYHNVQLNVSGASGILAGITMDSDPVLYLAILCDELQIWDRAPSGDALTTDYGDSALKSLEGEDIELTCSGPDDSAAIFTICHPRQSGIASGIKNALASRLPSYEKLVKVDVVATT